MVKVLLTRGEGAHVDCPTYDGATPLFIASAMGHDEVLSSLLLLLLYLVMHSMYCVYTLFG